MFYSTFRSVSILKKYERISVSLITATWWLRNSQSAFTFSQRDFIDDVTFKITSFLTPKRLSRSNSRNSSTGSHNVPFQMERLTLSIGPEMESFYIPPDQIDKTGPILGSGQYGTAVVGIYSGEIIGFG